MGRGTARGHAETKGHLAALQQAKRFGQQPPRSTLAWLAGIGDDLHARIVRAGLCDARSAVTPSLQSMASYVAGYIARRKDLGRRTLLNLGQVEAKLVEHFGRERSLASITVGDAKGFRQWLEMEGYGQATIAMHVKKARQFFGDAVDRELLAKNVFVKVKAGSQVNADRMQYVKAERVEAVMAVASPPYKLVLALARYAGLRCPSEPSQLLWGHVLWDKHQLVVTSEKTKKQGKPSRIVPIAARLREVLLEAFADAAEGETRVVPGVFTSSNLRTQIGRLCERAGVESWPKLLQNLRLSCETDWMDSDGLALACKWSGNTPEVALKHYHLVRETDFLRAAKRGAESGAEPVRIEGKGTAGTETSTPASAGISSTFPSIPFHALAGVSASVPPRGVEPLSSG
jgi:integrase